MKKRQRSSPRHRMRDFVLFTAALAGLAMLTLSRARADEHLLGFVRGTETVPQGHLDAYQFITLRTGKDAGTYLGWDFETEVEYGVADPFQISLSLENRYIYNKNVPDLDDTSHLTYGGLNISGKYRLLSPFKDPIGLALRLEAGWLLHDEVDGLREHELSIAPEIELQKNFLDDTLVTELNAGAEWAWGKQPAEQYPFEVSFTGGAGISYRFAPNWFVGLESHVRAEYPMFDVGNFEHMVCYAGPSLHYGTERWWATLSWNYQVYGHGVDESFNTQTFAEETRHIFRLKVGFNF